MTIIVLILHFYRYLNHFVVYRSEYDSYHLLIQNEFVLSTNLEVEVVSINIKLVGLWQSFLSKSSVLAKEYKTQQPNIFVFYSIYYTVSAEQAFYIYTTIPSSW